MELRPYLLKSEAERAVAVQVSILRVLHKILIDPRARKLPAMTELFRFATGLVRSLLARLVPCTQATSSGKQHLLILYSLRFSSCWTAAAVQKSKSLVDYTNSSQHDIDTTSASASMYQAWTMHMRFERRGRPCVLRH